MQSSRWIAFAVVSFLGCAQDKPPASVATPVVVASTQNDAGSEASSSAATDAGEDFDLDGMITVSGGDSANDKPLGHSGSSVPVGGGARLRFAIPQVEGKVVPEVIARITRLGSAPLVKCYEAALKRDPKLTGRVVIAFTISRSGSLSNVTDTEASVPDKTLVACAVQLFRSLSFPGHEGGVAKVRYPITFEPGPSS